MKRILILFILLSVTSPACSFNATPTLSPFEVSALAGHIMGVLKAHGFVTNYSVTDISPDDCSGAVTCDGFTHEAYRSSIVVYYTGEAIYYFPLDPETEQLYLQIIKELYGNDVSDWVVNHYVDAANGDQEDTQSGYDLIMRRVAFDTDWIYLIVSPR